jgi:ribonuclease HII
MLIGGVDEAGRGSIIGPMIVAGVSIDESKIPKLKEIGVRDSKQLTSQAREKLYDEIVRIVDYYHIHTVKPTEIDSHVLQKGLNRLEARVMAQIISKMMVDEVYVDCCDTNPERYKEHIIAHLKSTSHNLKIHSMHHADSINVVVSAASILAKIRRDLEIQKIKKRYHDIGSGYPSDERTMIFIRNWVQMKKTPPAFARRSWKPLRIILENMEQKMLL